MTETTTAPSEEVEYSRTKMLAQAQRIIDHIREDPSNAPSGPSAYLLREKDCDIAVLRWNTPKERGMGLRSAILTSRAYGCITFSESWDKTVSLEQWEKIPDPKPKAKKIPAVDGFRMYILENVSDGCAEAWSLGTFYVVSGSNCRGDRFSMILRRNDETRELTVEPMIHTWDGEGSLQGELIPSFPPENVMERFFSDPGMIADLLRRAYVGGQVDFYNGGMPGVPQDPRTAADGLIETTSVTVR